MTQLNRLGVLCGPSEYGKSTILRGQVIEHLASHPKALALIHDPHGEYEDLCRVYESPDAARMALERAAPGTPRGFSIRGSSSAVRDLAMEIGKRRNKKHDVRVPVLQGDDESSLMDSASKQHMSAEDLDLCSNRRHYGVYKLLNTQTVLAITAAWYANATDVWVLAQSNEDDARELDKRLGLPRGFIRNSPLWCAQPFRYLHWRRGKGLVSP